LGDLYRGGGEGSVHEKGRTVCVARRYGRPQLSAAA
jgi:hypothetical protein